MSWQEILKNNADKMIKDLVWDYYRKLNLENLIKKVYVNRRETPKTIYIEAKNAGMINASQKYTENKAQLIGKRGIHPNRIYQLFFQKWEVKII